MIRRFDPGVRPTNDYPTSDGKPMAETDTHRNLLIDLLATLKERYADRPDVYVSGDLLLFYQKGNKRRHVAPDVFVVFGVPKGPRDNYLVWQEGKGPDVVIELTSKTTRAVDQKRKPDLYRTRLGVKELFLFDPTEDYLDPPFQGFRRVKGEFRPVRPVGGRLPSKLLGLHLERDGKSLRLWDPTTGERLPTQEERLRQAQAAIREAEFVRATALEATRAAVRAEQAAAEACAEAAALRRELDELRRRLGGI